MEMNCNNQDWKTWIRIRTPPPKKKTTLLPQQANDPIANPSSCRLFTNLPHLQPSLSSHSHHTIPPIHTQHFLRPIPRLERRHRTFHASQIPHTDNTIISTRHYLMRVGRADGNTWRSGWMEEWTCWWWCASGGGGGSEIIERHGSICGCG